MVRKPRNPKGHPSTLKHALTREEAQALVAKRKAGSKYGKPLAKVQIQLFEGQRERLPSGTNISGLVRDLLERHLATLGR